MIQLVYSSLAAKPFSPEQLRTLLLRARENNTAIGLTGMLLHVDGAFLQVLEGDAEEAQKLFVKIGGDPRHHRILLLLKNEITERNFPDWSMGFFDASGRGTTLPGYRASAGFADLVGDPATIVRVVSAFRDGRWRSLAG